MKKKRVFSPNEILELFKSEPLHEKPPEYRSLEELLEQYNSGCESVAKEAKIKKSHLRKAEMGTGWKL